MQTGLDRLAEEGGLRKKVAGLRVALLAHPASVTRDLLHVSDVLEEHGVRPVVAFGPEHGYGGEAQDMIGVHDARDARGTRVRSLYGEHESELVPTAGDLDGVDVMVIDLQDVGARYYTFVWTAVLVMRACVARGIRTLVLDRPNPIGGDPDAVEGRLQERKYLSFVGLEPTPVRHSLTLGEIVAWRARVEGAPRGAVEVARTRGIDRHAHAPAWDRPFVLPSPNMPTYDTARVYPGGCLLEGTNLSEGRGCTRPFEIVGAPWIDGVRLANALHELALPGVLFRPLTFRPTFHKFAGEICGGVQVHPAHASAFRPYATYLALVREARAQDPERFRFRTERYEFRDDVPAFDLLTGSSHARRMIDDGADSATIVQEIAMRRIDDIEVVHEAMRAADDYFI